MLTFLAAICHGSEMAIAKSWLTRRLSEGFLPCQSMLLSMKFRADEAVHSGYTRGSKTPNQVAREIMKETDRFPKPFESLPNHLPIYP